MDELYPHDFDQITWDAIEELIDSGEYEEDEDGAGNTFIEFDMSDDNPFLRDEPDYYSAFNDVRRFLEEAGAEDDEIVTIYTEFEG